MVDARSRDFAVLTRTALPRLAGSALPAFPVFFDFEVMPHHARLGAQVQVQVGFAQAKGLKIATGPTKMIFGMLTGASFGHRTARSLLGDRLTVGQQTLTLLIVVR